MSPSRREREYARRRYEKWAAKQQQRAAQRRRAQRNAIAIGVTVIVVIGIAIGAALLRTRASATTAASPAPSPSAPSASASAASPSVSAGAAAPNPCPAPSVKPSATPKSWKTPPPKTLAAGTSWDLTLATSCGKITMRLDGAKAPQAVSSAIFLSRNGFWNGSPCHRLVTEGIFVLQCGDPTGSGSGGPGYSFGPVENVPANGVYPAGSLAMARAQSTNSNGSQFFIVYKDSTLPAPGYTIMGKVVSGLDVVQKVAAGGVAGGSDGAPKRPISILSTTVSPA